MVIVAEKERIVGIARDPAADRQATCPPPLLYQPRCLHNFSFPTLSWGTQRLLRCSKLSDGATAEPDGSADQIHRSSPAKSSPPRLWPVVGDSKQGETRGREGREVEKVSSLPAAEATRPWNLRTRRAACNVPAEERYGNHGPAYWALAIEMINPRVKTVRLRSDQSGKRETGKFSISLSRVEIEEDFFAIKGTKLPRRPKKRAKIVQRELNSLFPGSLLSEITPDSYKVVE